MVTEKPMIYSCSGCSSAAHVADWVARWLDREGVAEMGCIAGVGGGVGSLVAKAKAAKAIIAVDGCPLACTRACLRNAGLMPTRHVVLSELGVKKGFHESPAAEDLELGMKEVRKIAQAVTEQMRLAEAADQRH